VGVPQEYEARLNPFEEFKQAEAHRGRARLPAHDRALLSGRRRFPRQLNSCCHRVSHECTNTYTHSTTTSVIANDMHWS
jgi:hypothetical protein